jgi:hypothetical protein
MNNPMFGDFLSELVSLRRRDIHRCSECIFSQTNVFDEPAVTGTAGSILTVSAEGKAIISRTRRSQSVLHPLSKRFPRL